MVFEKILQDEIDRSSKSDAYTVLISYMFMFGYVVFSLGQYHVSSNNLRSMLVHSRILLGVIGLITAVASVTRYCVPVYSFFSSIGIFAFFNIQASLVCLEAQPFLVVVVGIDNIFLLVQSYQVCVLV